MYNMEKIATITLDGYFNYGNVLQRYALGQLLADMGSVVDSLWFSESAELLPYWARKYP